MTSSRRPAERSTAYRAGVRRPRRRLGRAARRVAGDGRLLRRRWHRRRRARRRPTPTTTTDRGPEAYAVGRRSIELVDPSRPTAGRSEPRPPGRAGSHPPRAAALPRRPVRCPPPPSRSTTPRWPTARSRSSCSRTGGRAGPVYEGRSRSGHVPATSWPPPPSRSRAAPAAMLARLREPAGRRELRDRRAARPPRRRPAGRPRRRRCHRGGRPLARRHHHDRRRPQLLLRRRPSRRRGRALRHPGCRSPTASSTTSPRVPFLAVHGAQGLDGAGVGQRHPVRRGARARRLPAAARTAITPATSAARARSSTRWCWPSSTSTSATTPTAFEELPELVDEHGGATFEVKPAA